MKRYVSKFKQNYQDQNNQDYDKKKEGEITIDDSGMKEKKNFSKDEGDYIDYEDVK